jgi:hypothetical protein
MATMSAVSETSWIGCGTTRRSIGSATPLGFNSIVRPVSSLPAQHPCRSHQVTSVALWQTQRWLAAKSSNPRSSPGTLIGAIVGTIETPWLMRGHSVPSRRSLRGSVIETLSVIRAASGGACLSSRKQKGPAAAAVRADTQFAAVDMTAGLAECRDLAGVRPVDPARQLSVPVPEQVSL